MTWWYLARAAGLVAVLTVTVTVCLGVAGTASGRDAATVADRHRTVDRRILHQLAHRSAAVLTLVLVALHVVLLVVDAHVDLTVAGTLVPFTAGFRPLALGLGTLAAYGLLALAVTGALRGRMAGSATGARLWRAVHLAAYAVWPLVLGHGLLAGSDTGEPWAWLLYGGSLLAVLVAGGVRLGRLERERSRPLAVTRHQLIGAPR